MQNTYSLWLIPSGEVYNKFAEMISRLSEENQSPNFEPHVTLIGGITGAEAELLAKTAQLAELIRPFKIRLDRIDSFPERHKALIIRTEKSNELIEANNKAVGVFNLPLTEYMPHLSLLYGEFIPETKEKIIENLGNKFNDEFEVKSICLYDTTGDEKNWHKIEEFSLK